MAYDVEAAEVVAEELFFTPKGRRDPYPRYHRLRELNPVHRSPRLESWLLTRYDDVVAILRDPRFGKDYPRQMETRFGASWREHSSLARGESSMLNLDGAAHTRLRSLVVKTFTRRTIDRMREAIERIVNDLLDPYAEAGGGDILDALAFPMPITVIGELLGVPEEDRPPFREWVRDLVAVFEMECTDEQLAAADAAQDHIRAYFDGLIDEKRKRPDDALLSTLVRLEDRGDRLTQDELATMASLVFGAGFETTTNLIGNGLVGLLRQPDQMEKLRERPELIPELPDEILRFDGTAQMVVRNTYDDVELGDAKIPKGEVVYAILGAANHDPAEFDDPDRIDVDRGRFRPMSFGGGAHFCLGAQLAKAEIEIVFRTLLERFDSIELRDSEPRFRDRLTLRGLETLDLAVVPAARRRDLKRVAAAQPAQPAQAAAPRETADTPPRGVRPTPGTDADRRWRNALREKVENDAATAAVEWVRSSADLAGTIVLLARAGLFQRCSAQEVAELAATAYSMTFEPGDRLCAEGAESLECYAIAEGEADVTIDGRLVRSVGQNDVVGERGPLEGNVRSATVTATTHMLTWAISRERLRELAERSPVAREGMFAWMKERYPDWDA